MLPGTSDSNMCCITNSRIAPSISAPVSLPDTSSQAVEGEEVLSNGYFLQLPCDDCDLDRYTLPWIQSRLAVFQAHEPRLEAVCRRLRCRHGTRFSSLLNDDTAACSNSGWKLGFQPCRVIRQQVTEWSLSTPFRHNKAIRRGIGKLGPRVVAQMITFRISLSVAPGL